MEDVVATIPSSPLGATAVDILKPFREQELRKPASTLVIAQRGKRCHGAGWRVGEYRMIGANSRYAQAGNCCRANCVSTKEVPGGNLWLKTKSSLRTAHRMHCWRSL